jgi:DNA-binding NtrC family response regulator
VKRVLIVDDDAAVTNYFLVLLTQTEQYEPLIVNDARRVPELLKGGQFDAVILDIDMPELNGVEILRMMRERENRTPVVVLTGVGDVEPAVKAMKFGAFDYLIKPADDEHLLEVLGEAVEHGRLRRSLSALPLRPRREDLAHGAAFESFITSDPRLVRILHEAEKMALGESTIFITGERGTPRGTLARAIHSISPRREGPFVSFDVSTEPPDVATSRIFGAARAWREESEERQGLVEEAEGGTLFIDHVECLGSSAQLRLKRVIQSGEFYRDNSTKVLESNARFVAGSALDLDSDEGRESFSQALLYHLMINFLRIPPIRERRSDIRLAAEHIARREAARTGKAIDGLEPMVFEFLERHTFPGNDAEVESVVASAVLRCEGTRVAMKDLPPCVLESGNRAFAPDFSGPRKLADVERQYVVEILESCHGDRWKAAAQLGISIEQIRDIVPEDG